MPQMSEMPPLVARLHLGIDDEHFLAHIMPFFMFSRMLPRSATSYSLFQCGPTSGQRAIYGPPQRCQWPADAFRKNIQI